MITIIIIAIAMISFCVMLYVYINKKLFDKLIPKEMK